MKSFSGPTGGDDGGMQREATDAKETSIPAGQLMRILRACCSHDIEASNARPVVPMRRVRRIKPADGQEVRSNTKFRQESEPMKRRSFMGITAGAIASLLGVKATASSTPSGPSVPTPHGVKIHRDVTLIGGPADGMVTKVAGDKLAVPVRDQSFVKFTHDGPERPTFSTATYVRSTRYPNKFIWDGMGSER
ncbi:MAG: hypothetical protein AAGJ40_09630 [Planctomycetota bacterium]